MFLSKYLYKIGVFYTFMLARDKMMNLNGPPPTNYHDRIEWEARRRGEPPTVAGCGWYNIPTDYHAREDQRRRYAQYRADWLKGR